MTTLAERLHALQHPGGPLEPVRKSPGPVTQAIALGPLAALPGSWTGCGFNAIWRPFHPIPPEENHHFLELNLTRETLSFEIIPGPVPNRGVLQPDINLFGLHYLQQIAERECGGGALHLEPGLWMNVPPTEDPADANATLVRLATIPHGNAVLMQTEGTQFTTAAGPPNIPTMTPFPGVSGITPFKTPEMSGAGLVLEPKAEQTIANDTKGNPNTNSNGPYKAPITQELVDDPNLMLREHLEQQRKKGEEVLSTTAFTVSSSSRGGGIENIPFLGTANASEPDKPTENNAFAQSAFATFWIETVGVAKPAAKPADAAAAAAPPRRAELPKLDAENLAKLEPFWEEETFLQLQYSQVVLLNFREILWPHVTVATLTLSNG
jgi:hypothetical protein